MVKVSDVEIRDEYITLDVNTKVVDGAKACKEKGVKYIVVLEGDEIKGVATASDFACKVVAEENLDKTLGDIMSSPAVVCDINDDVEDVAKKMYENDYSVLPVVSDKELKGVITAKDVIYALAEEHIPEEKKEAIIMALRPTLHGVRLG
jgi:CBS domain-containing protein